MNKNVTINGQRSLIIAFLREFGVLIPKIKKLEDDSVDWYLLTKEECTIHSRSFFSMNTTLKKISQYSQQ